MAGNKTTAAKTHRSTRIFQDRTLELCNSEWKSGNWNISKGIPRNGKKIENSTSLDAGHRDPSYESFAIDERACNCEMGRGLLSGAGHFPVVGCHTIQWKRCTGKGDIRNTFNE